MTSAAVLSPVLPARRSRPELTAASRPAPGLAAGRARDLVRALNCEWAELRERSQTTSQVCRWAGAVAALAGAQSMGELERSASGPQADAVLAGLLELAQSGDGLAVRTVLQLQLGAVVGLALRTRHYAGGDLAEAKARAVAALLEAIACYPLARRRRAHAAGLALDVLSRLTGHADNRPGRPVRSPDLLEVPHQDLLGALAGQPQPATDPEPRRQVLDLLAWAVRRGVLSAEDAELLRRQYTDTGGEVRQAELAVELGISHAALRKRSSRATRQLAAAMRQPRLLPGSAQPVGPSVAA